MWVYDLDSLRLIAVNDAAIAHYGYSRAKFLSMTIRDLRPGDELPSLEENLRSGSHGFERSGGWRHRKKDGTIIDVEIVSHELTFAGRRARVVLATDVTARRSAENAQRAQLVVAQRLVDSTTIDEAGPKLLDALGSTMGWDAATIWRVDGAGEALRFDTFWSVPTADPGLTADLEHSLRAAAFGRGDGWAGLAWETAEPVCEENGPSVDLCPGAAALRRASLHRAVAIPIVGSDGVLGVLEFFNRFQRPIDDGSLRTLTIASAQLGQFLERKRAEQALAYQALHDPLTGLPNRALFLDRLQISLANSRRRRGTVAVLFLDIDNFKVINDSLGHRAGDELLSDGRDADHGCAAAGRHGRPLRRRRVRRARRPDQRRSGRRRDRRADLIHVQRAVLARARGELRQREHRHRAVGQRPRGRRGPDPRCRLGDVPRQGPRPRAVRGLRRADARADARAAANREGPARGAAPRRADAVLPAGGRPARRQCRRR